MEIDSDTTTTINNSFLLSDFPSLTLSPLSPTPTNPRKKRTKFLKLAADAKPKPLKKPNPSAPKITPPCTECGKRFWSWKALFGHMRCHPERQWRGINPPPSLRRHDFTPEEHQVAAALLLLANGPPASNSTDISFSDKDSAAAAVGGRFECSHCKKVFSSRQALGGHRASHKNVKGCFANTKSDGEEEDLGCCSGEMMTILNQDDCINGHNCSICFRGFSSGQALGGHMRCHWEKVEEPSRVCDFDLNSAPPPPLLLLQEEDDGGGSSSSGVTLDLRLGF